MKLKDIKGLMMEEEFVRFKTTEKPHESLQVKAFNNAIAHQGEREICINVGKLDTLIINALNDTEMKSVFTHNDIIKIREEISNNLSSIIMVKK